MAEKHAEKMEDMMVPAHVAVILDGNGRWAKKEGFPVPWAIGRVARP